MMRKTEALEVALQHHIATQAAFHFCWAMHAEKWTIDYDERRLSVPLTVHTASESDMPALRTRISCEAEASLHIATGPLLRANLFITQDDQANWLHIALHHIVSDGISWRAFIEAVNRYYQQKVNDQSLSSDVNNDYIRWSLAIHEHAGQVPGSVKQYWDPINWRQAMPLPRHWIIDASGKQPVPQRLSFSLSVDETKRLLQHVVKAHAATINAVLLSALLVSWQELTHVTPLTLVCEGHGREGLDHLPNIDFSSTHGWFTSLYPLVLCLETDLLTSDWHSRVMHVQAQLDKVPRRGFDFLPLLMQSADKDAHTAFNQIPMKFNYLGQYPETVGPLHFSNMPVANPLGKCNSPTHLIDVESGVIDGALAFTVWVDKSLDVEAVGAWVTHFHHVLVDLIEKSASLAGGSPVFREDMTQLTVPSFPLSPLQQGLYGLCHASDDAALYTVEASLVMAGDISEENVKQCWMALVQSHDFFRTVLVEENATEDTLPRQVTLPQVNLPWLSFDITNEPAIRQKQSIQSTLEALRGHLMLEAGALLFRLVWFKLAEERYQFTWLHHHILVDGWTLNHVLSHFIQKYPNTDGVPELQPSFQSFINTQAQQTNGQEAKAFWTGHLSPLVEREKQAFVCVEERESNKSHGFSEEIHPLPQDVMQPLRVWARSQGLTVNTLCQLAWSLMLCYYTDEKVSCHGTTVNLKTDEAMTGLTINTVPICFKWQSNTTLLDSATCYQETVGDIFAQATWPLQDITATHGKLFDIELFNTLFIMEDYAGLPTENTHFRVVEQHLEERNHYPLTGLIKQQNNLVLIYDTHVFSQKTIRQFAARYVQLLAQLPTLKTLEDIDFLLPDEKAFLNAVNQTEKQVGEHQTLVDAFACAVQQYANEPALLFDGETMTYQALDVASTHVAHQLLAHGVKPGDIVPLLCERSFELMVILWGILKAGCAYLPLDKEWPMKRLDTILKDSRAAHWMVQDVLWAPSLATLSVTRIALSASIVSSAKALPSVAPTELAYVIYTSGSTGTPKGVMISHEAIMNRLHWIQDTYNLQAGEVVLQKTPYTFDVSVWELFWPLLCGGQLHMALPDKHKDPYYLLETITRHPIHYVHFVPSMLMIFLNVCQRKIKSAVKYVFSAGEPLSSDLAMKFYQIFSCQLDNLYGPTEACVIATHHACDPNKKEEITSIGEIVANTKAYVLSQHGYHYANLMKGELYLSGISLAMGYLNQAAISEKFFIRKNYGGKQVTLYKTGDYAYWDITKKLYYQGRGDEQIKLLGLRIEPQEIEEKLVDLDGISQAVVLPDLANKMLAAFIVCRNYPPGVLDDVQSAQLIKRLSKGLPSAFVPIQYIVVDSIPLLVSGKIDRACLLRQLASESNKSKNQTMPSCHNFAKLSEFIKKFLKLNDINPDQSLLKAGIRSIQWISLLLHINTEFKINITFDDVYQQPTIRSIVNIINQKKKNKDNSTDSIVPLKPSGSKTPLVLIHAIGGTVINFFPLTECFDSDRPLYGIQDVGLNDPSLKFKSFEEMAAFYLKKLKKQFGSKKFILGGLSFGATMAVEIVRQLGDEYTFPIVMIDGWAYYTDEVHQYSYLQQYLKHYYQSLEKEFPEEFNMLPQGLLSVHLARAKLLAQYKIQRVKQKIILFKARDTPPILKPIDAYDNHWSEYASQKIQIFAVPGSHDSLINKQNAPMLTIKLSKILNLVEEEQNILLEPFC